MLQWYYLSNALVNNPSQLIRQQPWQNVDLHLMYNISHGVFDEASPRFLNIDLGTCLANECNQIS